MLRVVLFFLSSLLWGGPPAAAMEWSVLDANVYSHHGRFGEVDRYLVVRYRVRNPGNAPVPVPVLWATTEDGQRLNDGIRPVVVDSYCNDAGCGRTPRSGAEMIGARIRPQESYRAIAVLALGPSSTPERVRLEPAGLDVTVGSAGGDAVSERMVRGRVPHTTRPSDDVSFISSRPVETRRSSGVLTK